MTLSKQAEQQAALKHSKAMQAARAAEAFASMLFSKPKEKAA